jgi:hypothetical protein
LAALTNFNTISMKKEASKQKREIGKIPASELIECYKYYFPGLPTNLLRRQIIGLKKHTEKKVFFLRNSKKREYSQSELVFIDNVNGYTYPSLMKKYNLSNRGIAKAIYETRKQLIEGIKKDVKKGVLTYTPSANIKKRAL